MQIRSHLLYVVNITTPLKTTFNFNKLVSDLDIHTNAPKTLNCKSLKFICPDVGHVITGNRKIISDSRICNIISKGPKYRFPNRIDLKNVGKK